MATQEKQNTQSSGKQGFASMDKDEVREIASKGGKAAHEKGTAHEFSHDEAVEAGKKGGSALSHSSASPTSHTKNEDEKSSGTRGSHSASSKGKEDDSDEDDQKGTHARGSHSSKSKNDDSDHQDDEDHDTRRGAKSGKQGFAAMDKEHQKEVASKGGKK